MMSRYKTVIGSQSWHCCFEVTVVDTQKPFMIGGERMFDDNGNPKFESVCECFDVQDAEKICMALNMMDGKP